MLAICAGCKSPRLVSEGKSKNGWWVKCSTCGNRSKSNVRPRWRRATPVAHLFRLASDSRPATAFGKAEELFAEAMCAQIPFEVMEETIAISEGERARLEFLVSHGIIPSFALETHIRFRETVLAHFRELVRVHGKQEEKRHSYVN